MVVSGGRTVKPESDDLDVRVVLRCDGTRPAGTVTVEQDDRVRGSRASAAGLPGHRVRQTHPRSVRAEAIEAEQ